ncbi:Ethylene-responsive transcription factor [Quillaja saponaria]|nr:Ethylene-responsive transcription factor [Quillaja saponaria]
MAAAAYDVAAIALKGNDAVLNFPDSIGSYPIPASSSPADIRLAATAAAANVASSEKGESSRNDHESLGDFDRNENIYSSSIWKEREFVDEEAIFGMPGLLVDMAEGMLVSPPRMSSTTSDDFPEQNAYAGDNLWGYCDI